MISTLSVILAFVLHPLRADADTEAGGPRHRGHRQSDWQVGHGDARRRLPRGVSADGSQRHRRRRQGEGGLCPRQLGGVQVARRQRHRRARRPGADRRRNQSRDFRASAAQLRDHGAAQSPDQRITVGHVPPLLGQGRRCDAGGRLERRAVEVQNTDGFVPGAADDRRAWGTVCLPTRFSRPLG